jgi:hypothetical protein
LEQRTNSKEKGDLKGNSYSKIYSVKTLTQSNPDCGKGSLAEYWAKKHCFARQKER